MNQRVYYPPGGAGPEVAEPQPRTDVLWDWTVAEIHDLARSAALANRWLVSDFTLRFEAAWDGIVDAILAAPARPSRHDLQAAGKGAISRGLLKDFCHTYGVAERDLTAGVGSGPRFAAYWLERGDDPFDHRAVERIAVGQVMAAIGPRHARLIEALAAAPDMRSAAEALGIPRTSLSAYMTEARRAFERLWYAPETPPRRKYRPARYSPSEWNMSRLAACGTPAAYERHRRKGDVCEDPDACQEAARKYEFARHAKYAAKREAG